VLFNRKNVEESPKPLLCAGENTEKPGTERGARLKTIIRKIEAIPRLWKYGGW